MEAQLSDFSEAPKLKVIYSVLLAALVNCSYYHDFQLLHASINHEFIHDDLQLQSN